MIKQFAAGLVDLAGSQEEARGNDWSMKLVEVCCVALVQSWSALWSQEWHDDPKWTENLIKPKSKCKYIYKVGT